MNRKISILVISRSKTKSILLGILVMLITLFSIMSVSLYYNSEKLLQQADEQYTTLAVVEYTAGDYPDETSMKQETLVALNQINEDAIEGQEYVKECHKQTHLFGYLEGTSLSNASFRAPFMNCAVIIFRVMYETDDDNYRCVLIDSIYSEKAKPGTSFGLSQEALGNVGKQKLHEGHTYISSGDFRKEDSLLVFSAMKGSGISEDIDPAKNIKSFPFTDITNQEDYLTSSPEMEYWNQIADAYRVMNGSFQTVAVDSLEKQTPFFLGGSRVTDGRMFTDEEAKEGKKVCVIHNGIAAVTGVKVGDTIRLKHHYTDNQKDFYCGYTSKIGVKEENEYNVIGIYEESQTTKSKYVYVPENALKNLPKNQKHYAIANYVIQNGKAKEFEEAIKPYMLDHMRVEIMDQGYTQTVAPIYAMRTNALFISLLSLICTTVVLILFAIIHISKQRESVAIMTALGTGQKLIHQYLATGTYILAGAGCLCGALIGWLLAANVSNLIYQRSVKRYAIDLRFSNLSIGMQKTFHGHFDRSLAVPLIIALIIFVITVLICRLYASRVIKQTYCFGGNKPKKARKKKEHTKNINRIKEFYVEEREIIVTKASFKRMNRFRFVWFHSMRSIIRNYSVSILMILIPLASAVFMLLFSNVIDNYYVAKEKAYEEIPVEGYFVSAYGRLINCNNIDEGILGALWESNNIEQEYCSSEWKYEYIGCIDEALGSEEYERRYEELEKEEAKRLAEPVSSFAKEAWETEIFKLPELVATDSIGRAKEFFGFMPPSVDYEPGHEDLFSKEESEFLEKKGDNIKNVLVDEGFLKEHELKKGNIIVVGKVLCSYDYFGNSVYDHLPLQCRIVGTYRATNGRKNIYMPRENDKPGQKKDFRNYRLKNTAKLSQIRNNLQELGVQPVGYMGEHRISFIIQDKELVQTIENIDNNIMFMSLLRYILFGLIVVIGFVSAYLSMRTRQKELAMIRSMGTGRTRTFYMFFREQSTITFIGIAIGTILAFLYIGELSLSRLLLTIGLYACYMVGSGLCIMKMNQTNILNTLSVSE